MLKLYPHQEKAVKESPHKWGLWFRQRVGKTATAIRLCSTRAKSALIVCPKSLKKQWEKEVEVWNNSDCKFYIITKEDLRLGKNLPKEHTEAIVGDEVHIAMGNFKSQTYKSFHKYAKECKFTWLLTGTPMTATNWCIYSYAKLLGFDYNYIKWREHFNYPMKMGRRIIWQPKKGMEKELQDILRKIGTVIDLKDIADVVDDEDVFEYFSLNAVQKQQIKLSFDPMPIIRYTKQHQIESGILIGDAYNKDIIFDCSKDRRIKELVESTDKIVIVVRYISQMNKYAELLKDCGKRIFKISGQEKLSASEVAYEAENSDKGVVLIQGDTVAGYSLMSYSTVVFASMSYSFVNYDQVRFRTKNMEKKTACTYIHLLTDGKSIDQAVYDSVSRKQDFSIELYAK